MVMDMGMDIMVSTNVKLMLSHHTDMAMVMVMDMDMVTDMDMVMVMGMDTMEFPMVIVDSDTMVYTNVQLSHHTDIPITVTAMDMDTTPSAMVIMDTAMGIMDSAMVTMVFTSVQLSHHMDIPIMVMVMGMVMDTMHAPTDTMDMVTPMSLSAVTIKLFSL